MDEAHGTLEKGVAEKFARTTSRLYALCEVVELGKEEGRAGLTGDEVVEGKGEWGKEGMGERMLGEGRGEIGRS